MAGILIVDDQKVVREGLKKMISDMNIEFEGIYEAADGLEALQTAEEKDPDILIVDIMMPNMNGLEFIKKFRAIGSNAKIIIVSAHRDFKYAKTAISYHVNDYIVKPITKNELYPILLSIKNEIVETRINRANSKDREMQYYYRLFLDFLSGDNIFFDFPKFIECIGVKIVLPCFKVAIISIAQDDDASSLKERIDQSFSREGIIYFSFCSGNGSLVYIMNNSLEDDVWSNMLLENTLNHLKNDVNVGVSGTLEGRSKLKTAYKQAEQALSECKFKGARVIIHNEDEGGGRFKKSIISMKDYITIINIIRNGSKSELDTVLKDIFIRISKKDCSIKDVENLIIGLLSFIHLQLSETYPDLFDLKRAVESIFEGHKSIFSIKLAVKQFFDDILERFENSGMDSKVSGVVERALRYINKNFEKDITLNKVASELGINYSYLSNLFTVEMDITFSEYITRIRMEKACRLLLESKKKITDIAESCGYPDSKYFFRVFKKQFGVTPEEYKKSFIPEYKQDL